MRLLFAAILLPSPLRAQAASTPASTPVAAEKKICRQSETPTGSVMAPRRTCHTAGEWATIDAGGKAARDQAQRELDNRRSGPMGN